MVGRPIRAFVFGHGDHVHRAQRIDRGNRFGKDSGVGWVSKGQILSRDRGRPNARYAGLVLSFKDATLRIRIPPGRYRARFVFGDTDFDNHATVVRIPSIGYVSPIISGRREEFTSLDVSLELREPILDIEFTSPINNWIVNFLVLVPQEDLKEEAAHSKFFAPNQWSLPAEMERGPSDLLRSYRQAAPAPAETPTDLFAADYLKAARGIVDHFGTLQDSRGAIIDPKKEVEFQYATPFFAYAAALCGTEADDAALVDRAALAFDWAVRCLNAREAPNRHEDFYSMPLAHAYRLLVSRVSTERSAAWADLLRNFDPFRIYRSRYGGQDGPGSNWNCKALSGEFFLQKYDLRDDSNFLQYSIRRQGRFFQNMYGLYSERPMVYDIFPRAWLTMMHEAGYDGDGAVELAEALRRGTITSLFMQSPTGAIPCGGRSSHHQWPDAMQCIIFEIAAGRAKRDNDAVLSGIYKRAARRALKEILQWQRDSGEFEVVKNHFEPANQHGYERYSSHSQYNLLLAGALCFAYDHSLESDDVEEVLTPAEHGVHLIDLAIPFEKVVGSAAGTHVVIVKKGEARQTPAGLVRVHFDELPSVLGFSDGLVPDSAYYLPKGPRAFLSAGLCWEGDDGDVSSIADLSERLDDVTVVNGATTEDSLVFGVLYPLPDGQGSLREDYVLQRRRLTVSYHAPDALQGVRVRWPVFVEDGRDVSRIDNRGDSLDVTFLGKTVTFAVEGCGPIEVDETLYPHRSGFVRVASAAVAGKGTPPRMIISAK